jgi:hypothetical protein
MTFQTTLQRDLSEAQQKRQDLYIETNYKWMLEHEHLITHALTLTFSPDKITAYTRAFSRSVSIHDKEMVERYQDSLRLFVRLLDTSLFGNASKRYGDKMLFVPVLEGLNQGQVPHFHCSVGIPTDRAEVFESKVKEAWSKAPFSGFQIKVEPYRDAGWLGYSVKESKFPNRLSIDWSNIRVPFKS